MDLVKGAWFDLYDDKELRIRIVVNRGIASVENLKNWSKREIDYSKRIGYAED